jgi:hypothetical protein
MAGGLPFKYMAATMLGQGVAGIASNVLRAATLYFFPVSKLGSLYKGALIFFLINATFMLICGYC